MQPIFDYDDYKKYLLEWISNKEKEGRGFRSLLADKIRVQRPFITQVLSGKVDFNLEHADAVSQVLEHSPDEADFFILQVLYARAGSQRLRTRFLQQMESIRKSRLQLKNRFKEKDALSTEDKTQYYSSWLYGAIRVLVTIPQYQSREKVLDYFHLPRPQVDEALQFLISRKLLEEKKGKLQVTEKHLYLGNDNKMIRSHHSNWRIRAIKSLDFEQSTDLHFSAVNSLSKKDLEKIRARLVEMISEIRETVKDSKEEVLYSICLDLFEAQ